VTHCMYPAVSKYMLTEECELCVQKAALTKGWHKSNPPCASSEDGHTTFQSSSMTAAPGILNSYGIHGGTTVIVAQDSLPVSRCHACKLSPDPVVEELCCHLCILT